MYSFRLKLVRDVIILFGIASIPAFAAQLSTQQERPEERAFEQLGHWRHAVLAGDQTVLSAMYSTAPRAFAQTPEGHTTDLATEESEFWSKQADGLIDIVPKILEETSPLGAVKLVLRIEMIFQNSRSVVSATQIWVKEDDEKWRIRITYRNNPEPMLSSNLPEPRTLNPHLYPDPNQAQNDLDAALESAREDDERILVIFGANWCYDCHVLDAALHSEEAAHIVSRSYRVVHINIGDGDANGDLAKRFGMTIDKGIPSIAVLNAKGELLSGRNGKEFQPTTHSDMSDLAGFLERFIQDVPSR